MSLPLLSLPIDSQQNVAMVGNSATIEVPHLSQIHKQGLEKDHNLSSTVCQHTPASPFLHSQHLPFCKSQLTRDPTPPSFLHANVMTIRKSKFYIPGELGNLTVASAVGVKRITTMLPSTTAFKIYNNSLGL